MSRHNIDNIVNMFYPAFAQAEKLLQDFDAGHFKLNSWPPFNIERHDENTFKIVLAVAGWDVDELDVSMKDNVLSIKGSKKEKAESENVQFVYKGMAQRDFLRKVPLGDYIKVKGAQMKNGLLTIDLIREIPEEKKPQKIKIDTSENDVENVETSDDVKQA